MQVDGRRLIFGKSGDDSFTDVETGTTCNDFWFAWQAFFPDAEVYEG